MPKRGTIYALCLLTLLGFSGIAELLLYFGHDTSIIDLAQKGWSWYWQVSIGLIVGWIAGQLAKWIIASKPLRPVKVEYISAIRQLRLRP